MLCAPTGHGISRRSDSLDTLPLSSTSQEIRHARQPERRAAIWLALERAAANIADLLPSPGARPLDQQNTVTRSRLSCRLTSPRAEPRQLAGRQNALRPCQFHAGAPVAMLHVVLRDRPAEQRRLASKALRIALRGRARGTKAAFRSFLRAPDIGREGRPRCQRQFSTWVTPAEDQGPGIGAEETITRRSTNGIGDWGLFRKGRRAAIHVDRRPSPCAASLDARIRMFPA